MSEQLYIKNKMEYSVEVDSSFILRIGDKVMCDNGNLYRMDREKDRWVAQPLAQYREADIPAPTKVISRFATHDRPEAQHIKP